MSVPPSTPHDDLPLLARARASMPGGVSSPVRAFGAVQGDPPFVVRGEGAQLFDRSGKRYVDLVGSWGPLILGHAHPAVVEAVQRTAADGLSFGATCEAEVELAEAILRRFPFADRVRFTSSGTEAVMSALRLARGATGRDRVVKFEGCYHGHFDALLVKGGSGLATFGTPSSGGVPEAFTALTEVLPLDDEAAASALFADKGSEIACVVIEPMPANAGLLEQRQAFLEHLRSLCDEHGALLLFDEVISGFRVAPGGMTERSGIRPDLVTVGKIVGGGMPVGAFMGSENVMELLAPNGPVYHAGTLSGNPLAMAAGRATLAQLDEPGVYATLEARGARLEQGWRASLDKHGLPAGIARVGSVLWLSLQPGPPPRAFHLVGEDGPRIYSRLHPAMLERGLWMAPSAYEVAFVSTAHSEADIDEAIAAFDAALGAVLTEAPA
ncbi:MAG: glutamate-1-semialdehyde 2,1-aminomutase [Planctomycetota bacterium]|nr:MAG: glutamate-1-semialdehyde 2,1-aminomutase [Planctomycetota bacterium]